MQKGKVIAIVPARAGSKRVANKNRRRLSGRPLIDWSVEAALAVESLDAVVVSTDDVEIQKHYRSHKHLSDNLSHQFDEFTPLVVLNRPRHLADDHASTTAVIHHVIESLNLSENDVLVLLQPTSPLRNCHTISEAINLSKQQGWRSVISVSPLGLDPSWCLTINSMGRLNITKALLNPKRTQDVEPHYVPNGAIYIKPVGQFQADDGFYGEGAVPYIMSAIQSVDIDTEEDFLIAEALAEHLAKKMME